MSVHKGTSTYSSLILPKPIYSGEQCQLGDLPNEVSGHSGTEISGVPIFCGGLKDEVDQGSDYKNS